MSGTRPDAALQKIRRDWQLWQPDPDSIDLATALCLRNTHSPAVVTAEFEIGNYRMTACFEPLAGKRPADDLTAISFAATRPDNAPDIITTLAGFATAGPGDLLIEGASGRAWLFASDRLVDLELQLRRAHRLAPRLHAALKAELPPMLETEEMSESDLPAAFPPLHESQMTTQPATKTGA